MTDNYMMIDGMPVAIDGEKNLLELIRKVGVELPTFCYYSELSVYGACRMCMVENQWGGMEAACSTPPKKGMEIYTNTPRLRKYRKMILELLLSNHCRDCTTCGKNGECRLQELALRFGIDRVRFANQKNQPKMDESSRCIARDESKCILCGDCVRMCSEVQHVGAIDFVGRGSGMTVAPAFLEPIANSCCVGCGQCAAVCPTGAIVVKNDTAKVWDALMDADTKVVVQIAPAVRVGIGRELGIKNGENAMGRVVAALRRMGFDQVFDTTTGADLTVLEESNELLERLESGKLPLFTSCCPAWVNYAEQFHPELLGQVSTCRSPMEMFAAVLKEHFRKTSGKKVVCVAVMPCTAKKFEASREEFQRGGTPLVDYVITTKELIQMIRESGLVFSKLPPEGVDMPFGMASGAGVIFGVSGGVAEAVLRRLQDDKSPAALSVLAFRGVRGLEGVREARVTVGEKELSIAVASGLANAEKLIQAMKDGQARYDFVEVMACPGGCVSGAGQPFVSGAGRRQRREGIYEADRMSGIKRAEENPVLLPLYNGLLKGRVHELLHVSRPGEEKTAR